MLRTHEVVGSTPTGSTWQNNIQIQIFMRSVQIVIHTDLSDRSVKAATWQQTRRRQMIPTHLIQMILTQNDICT